jgi:hypothetical protein
MSAYSHIKNGQSPDIGVNIIKHWAKVTRFRRLFTPNWTVYCKTYWAEPPQLVSFDGSACHQD